MSMRGEGATAGLMIGLSLILAPWAAIQPADAKRPPKQPGLDPEKALLFEIEWASLEGVDAPHIIFKHECCGCGLTHVVLIVVRVGGLEMYWWTDREATRLARRKRSLPDGSPEYSAENPGRYQ